MISVLEIWGHTGSKMEFFESFSQSMHRIFLILGLKEQFMVLHVCVKFWVMHDFGSEDMGSYGVKNGVFREFRTKYALDLSDSWAERTIYGT